MFDNAVSAFVGQLDGSTALVYGALVGEEFEVVVGDLCCDGGAGCDIFGGAVESISDQNRTGPEHHIPVPGAGECVFVNDKFGCVFDISASLLCRRCPGR